MKRILVDMSATILHNGHIRLLEKASEFGLVVVALTTDVEIELHKGYSPELNFEQRKEILSAIKFVSEVVPSPWKIDPNFLKKHRIDLLVHGDDNVNEIPQHQLLIFPRTIGVSSTQIRQRSAEIFRN